MINLSNFILDESSVDFTNITNVGYMYESSTELMFNYLLNFNEECNNASKDLYKSITEAETYEVINESFADFYEKVKEIIKKFLDFIKRLFERFITSLNKFVNSEKYLLKHKDTFSKFNSEHEFDFEGYTFTIDDPMIPVIEAKAQFNQEFMNLELDKFKEDNIDAQKAYMSDLSAKLKSSLESFYDKFRGEVIGKPNYPIAESDYSNELFMVYRDGYDTKSTITADASLINDALIRLKNYKDKQKDVKVTKKKIENEYKVVQKSIENMISRNKDNKIDKLVAIDINGDYTPEATGDLRVSEDVLTSINAYIKANVDKVEKMSAIHGMAFSYKLDAIKDCYIQDKKILYNALNRIQKKSLIGGEK